MSSSTFGRQTGACGCDKTNNTNRRRSTPAAFLWAPPGQPKKLNDHRLKPGIKKQETAVLKEIRKLGYRPHVMRGVARTVIGAIGDELTHQSRNAGHGIPGRGRKRHAGPETLQTRQPRGASGQLDDPGARHVIGGKKFHVMAGPCSVESEKQMLKTAGR